MLTLLFIGVLLILAVRTPLFVVIGALGAAGFYAYVEGYQTFDSLQVMVGKITTLTNKNVLLVLEANGQENWRINISDQTGASGPAAGARARVCEGPQC